jgi:hypothetical protein
MSEATRFRESPDAQQLADALRTRYTARREQPDADELSADLRRLGDLASVPAVAKPGVTSMPMKAARAVLRVLLRPWLAVQTEANHEVARRLQRVSGHVSHLLRGMPEVEESLQHLDARLRAIEQREVPSPALAPEPSAADLERMFVHMHLGRPPARLLVLGSTASMAGELAAFGFDVTRGDPAAETFNVNGGSLDAGRTGRLFDAVIALPDEAGEQAGIEDIARAAARALRPGGMLLGAWRGDAWSAATAGWRSVFEPHVVMVAESADGGWQVREPLQLGTTTPPAGDGRTSVMLQASRVDAPAR